MTLSKFYLILFSVLMLGLSGCSVKYSFTGTNINYELVKSFSVENFFNDAGDGPANMEQRFTEALKEYYQRNTQLELVRTNGDLQFSGSIVATPSLRKRWYPLETPTYLTVLGRCASPSPWK